MVGIFYKEFLPETRRNDGTELQSLASVSNVPGLNPKSFDSAYNVKEYVPLLVVMAYTALVTAEMYQALMALESECLSGRTIARNVRNPGYMPRSRKSVQLNL